MTARKAEKERMLTSRTGICKQGFTLLELVIVIFIISLLSAVVFPSFRSLEEKKLQADARRVASLLRYLNDNAIATKGEYSLKFDFKNNSISWKGNEGDKTEEIKSLAGLILQSKGESKEGQTTVLFGPMGIQEAMEILLRDRDNEMKVSFNPVSGRAKIEGNNK